MACRVIEIIGPDGPITDFSPLGCLQRLRDWTEPANEREWRNYMGGTLTELGIALRTLSPAAFRSEMERHLLLGQWDGPEAEAIASRLCQHPVTEIRKALEAEERLAYERIGEFTPPEPGGYLRWKGA